MKMTIHPSLIAVDSQAGAAMLAAQPATSPVWALLSHWVTQSTQSFCSLASSSMLLNAVGAPAPFDSEFSPYPYFTQTNVLGACALSKPSSIPGQNISAHIIVWQGATLEEMSTYLRCWASTSHAFASESTAVEFRARVRAALESTPPSAVAINFHRSGLHEVGGGHVSPLGAYDVGTDRFLLLDVSRYKYPAVWVTAEILYAAMNTTDTTSGRSRGWVVVDPPTGEVTALSNPTTRPNGWRRDVHACMSRLELSDTHGVLACRSSPHAPVVSNGLL